MPEGLTALWHTWTASAPALLSPVYPLLSAGHILALAILVGAVAILDLRLLGSGPSPGTAQWAPWLANIAAAGLAGAVLTGFLLFSVQASHYLANGAFRVKLLLIALASVNALAVRLLPDWRGVLAGSGPTRRLQAMAGLSLLSWISVLVAGRYIAFV